MGQKWEPEQFEYAFQVWFENVIEHEVKAAKSFKKGDWCELIKLDDRRFRYIKKPGSKKIQIRLDDIVKIANGLNMSPVDILKKVTDQYKKGSQPTQSNGAKHAPVVKKNAM